MACDERHAQNGTWNTCRMNKEQREKLTEIIEADNGTSWWQPALFEKNIKDQLPTDLKIISVPPNPAGNFNCFVYALGLENDKEFLGGQNPIQKEFIRYLLDRGTLQLTEKPVADDLIFYENEEGAITHGGIVQADGSILSKWMWGALFAHKIWDVPSSFGDKIFYTQAPDSKVIKQVYEEYKATGVKIDPIS